MKFPVFYPVTRESRTETGSLVTPSSSGESANPRSLLSTPGFGGGEKLKRKPTPRHGLLRARRHHCAAQKQHQVAAPHSITASEVIERSSFRSSHLAHPSRVIAPRSLSHDLNVARLRDGRLIRQRCLEAAVGQDPLMRPRDLFDHEIQAKLGFDVRGDGELPDRGVDVVFQLVVPNP
jgi:hypothetical protein